MIRAAERAVADWRLIYGGRTPAPMAFLDELAEYGHRVSIQPQGETGLLDLDRILRAPEPNTLVYRCGPEPLLAAVERCCSTWPSRSLHIAIAPVQQVEGGDLLVVVTVAEETDIE